MQKKKKKEEEKEEEEDEEAELTDYFTAVSHNILGFICALNYKLPKLIKQHHIYIIKSLFTVTHDFLTCS